MNHLNASYADQLISEAKEAISHDSTYKLIGIRSRIILLKHDLFKDLPTSKQVRKRLRIWIGKINEKLTKLNRQQIKDILNRCDYGLKHAQQILDHPDPRPDFHKLAQDIIIDADLALNALKNIRKTRYMVFLLKEEDEFSHQAFAIETKAQALKNINDLEKIIRQKQTAILEKEAAKRQQQVIHQIKQAREIKQQLNQALATNNYDLARTLLYQLETFDHKIRTQCFYPQDAGMQIRHYQDQVRALARERAAGNKVPVL